MKIDIRTKDCLFVEINGWTYYIDDSTGEQIISKWNKDVGDGCVLDCTKGVLV